MKIRTLVLAVSLCFSNAVFAQKMPFWGAKAPVSFDTPSQMLKKGEFTWAPTLAPSGPIVVLVSLDEQRAYTYRNGILIGTATVSTGKPGYETPTGVFVTKMKDKDHHSSKYNNAAMPYTQRFTNDGVALHAGGIPGYPESHGCVHLPSEYARLLFGVSPVGMTVVVSNKKSSPEIVNHPPFLAPITDKGKIAENRRLFPNEDYRWEPEKSAEGATSIVISRYDNRLVVLRNGIEIGRSKIKFHTNDQPVGTHLLVAHEDAGNSLKWISSPITGHMDDTNALPESELLKQIIIPHDFHAMMLPVIVSGTTLMVTDAPILEHTTGVEMSVMSSHPDA